MDVQKQDDLIKEAFEIEAEEIGFCLDQLWGDYENPYENSDTALAFNLFKKGWLAKAQAVPEWIETAIQPPEEGQKVIISGIYGVGIAEFSYMYKDEFVMYDMGASNPILSKDQVKFWQPLPDAPRESAND